MKKRLLPLMICHFGKLSARLRQCQIKALTCSAPGFGTLRRAQWSQLSAILLSLRKAQCIAIVTCLLSFVYCPSSLHSQTIPPPFINYQAVLYDVNNPTPNAVFANQSFQTFVNINDELGNLLYREEHYASTDGNGLITVKMGDGLYVAGPITNFNQIDWGTGKYYLVVDFNINGTISSTAPEQLVTVPYSFYSGKAGNGMTSVSDNGNGTLTFTYANGSTYTTPTLSGIQGPVGATGAVGPTGQSAYELWLAQGNTGSVQDYLSTSAYQIWLAQGNTGTTQDFLNTLVGPSGASGQAGPQGVAGIQGPIGPTGPQGIQGPIGPVGAAGPQGIQGPAGANGKSAYEIAVLNGYIGTETQWLLSLVGAQGPAGQQGFQGGQGPQGVQGTPGQNGLNALIKTTSEAAGANCANGGTKIETGLDANGNGLLDAGEVVSGQTKYVCNGTGNSIAGSDFFNVKLPDGLKNVVKIENQNLPFTIPNGKNFILRSYTYSTGQNYGGYTGIKCNNINFESACGNCGVTCYSRKIIGEGMILTSSFGIVCCTGLSCPASSCKIFGYLIDKTVQVVFQNTPYTVPVGFKFIVYQFDSATIDDIPNIYNENEIVPASTNGYIIPN